MQHEFYNASKSENEYFLVEHVVFISTVMNNIFFEKGMSGKFVRLVKDKLHYMGPADLTNYFVVSYKMNETIFSIGDNNGIQVDIIFSRRLFNQILTIFLPCMLLCILAFTTILYRV